MRISNGVRIFLVAVVATSALACGTGSSNDVADDVSIDTSADEPQTAHPDRAIVVEHDDRTKRCTEGMDWIVWVEPGAGTGQIDGIERAVLQVEHIERVTYLDAAAAEDEAQELFADNPQALAALNANTLPTSFRVWSSSTEDPPTRLTRLSGVREVTVCTTEGETTRQCQTLGTAWIVFFNPGTSESDIESVRTRIEEIEGVDSIVYVDQAGAYEEFGELFADSPEMIDKVSPEILPASIRVWSATGAEPPLGLEALSTVREIVYC